MGFHMYRLDIQGLEAIPRPTKKKHADVFLDE